MVLLTSAGKFVFHITEILAFLSNLFHKLDIPFILASIYRPIILCRVPTLHDFRLQIKQVLLPITGQLYTFWKGFKFYK